MLILLAEFHVVRLLEWRGWGWGRVEILCLTLDIMSECVDVVGCFSYNLHSLYCKVILMVVETSIILFWFLDSLTIGLHCLLYLFTLLIPLFIHLLNFLNNLLLLGTFSNRVVSKNFLNKLISHRLIKIISQLLNFNQLFLLFPQIPTITFFLINNIPFHFEYLLKIMKTCFEYILINFSNHNFMIFDNDL